MDSEAILETLPFNDVLFTNDTKTPANVMTGETPAHSQPTVEEATEFAVDFEADYQSGDLTIIVERADES